MERWDGPPFTVELRTYEALPQCACLSAPTSFVPSPHINVTKPLLLSLVITSSYYENKEQGPEIFTCMKTVSRLLINRLTGSSTLIAKTLEKNFRYLLYLLLGSHSCENLNVLNDGVKKLG